MKGKVVLIVGGSGGIGIETAKVLSSKGADICLTYYNNEQKLKDKLKMEKLDISKLYKIDLTEEESVRQGIIKILKEVGKIDVVVYCASAPLIPKRISDLNWNDYQEHLNVQIKGLYAVVKCLLPLINEGRSMKCIAVASEACIGKPPSMLAHYVTAKYGLMGLVKCMASELGGKKCTFNMVSPGMVDTSLLSNMPQKLIEFSAEKNPFKRIAMPLDVANVIAFLASDKSGYINGANIPVNGGNIFA